ncbi:MAG: Cof-type HAD-IIB family hydrolase [Acetilactobacillus jinshanensis]
MPVICTGRNIKEIQSIIEITGIDTLITENGSYIKHHQTIRIENIRKKVIKELVDLANQLGDAVGFRNANGVAVTKINKYTRNCYGGYFKWAKVDPYYYLKKPINFLNVFTDGGDVQKYRDAFKDELAIIQNDPHVLDINRADVSKATGIQDVLTDFHWNGLPTYCFGDAYNDIPMFKKVQHSVAMANADDKCKQRADHVTDSNNDNGIAHGLRYYHLI